MNQNIVLCKQNAEHFRLPKISDLRRSSKTLGYWLAKMAIERTQLNLRVSFITIFIKLTIWCNSHTECFLCEGKIYIIILHSIFTHKDLSTCIHFILFYQSLFPTEWLQGIALCSGYRVVSLATWNNSIRVIALLSYDTVTGQSSSSSSSFLESTAAAFTARAKSSLLACKRSPGKRMSKYYYFFSSKNS